MKISRLVLAAVVGVIWGALPLAVRANDGERDGDEENVEIHKRMRHGEGEGPREGMGGREGREGPGGHHGMNPELKAKFEKMRELEDKVREVSKKARQGTDAEKAAAKNETRKLLGELFDAKLALDVAMLEKMEKHAAELREKITNKKSSREKAIENRLARLTGEGDEW